MSIKKVIRWICSMGLLGVVFISGSAFAGDSYYLAPQGSDGNNGDINSPWHNLSYAITVATAGDTIVMRGGTYVMDEVYIDRKKNMGGTAENYLTIKAFPGEEPILQYSSRRFIIWADYVRVEGLHFIMPWRCDAFGAGLQIVNNTFTGEQPKYGAIETGGTDILIEGNHIEINDPVGNTQDHGIYVHKGQRITVKNNTIIGTKGYGIHVYDEHKSSDPIEWAANPFSIKDYVIEGNMVMNSQTRTGLIVAKGRGGTFINLENIIIRNNVFADNAINGVFIREGNNIQVLNNTFFMNAYPAILVDKPSAAGVTVATGVSIKNNIFVGPVGRWHVLNNSGNAIVLENNLYDRDPDVSGALDPFSVIGDPLFQEPAQQDFTLKPASPAIDAGINVGLPFVGGAPDLGAYEFGNQTLPSAPVLSSPSQGAVVSTTLTIAWNALGGGASYHVQVSTQPDFSTTVTDESGLTGLSLEISNLSAVTTYYWRVRASNSAGTGPWSTIWQFTTQIAPPAAPVLSFPVDSAIVSTNPILVWNEANGAASYQLHISTVPDFSTLELDRDGIIDTSFQVTELSANTTYYWRLRGTNSVGISTWSSAWKFVTDDNISSIGPSDGEIPEAFRLSQNYPNPFNPETRIAFEISSAAKITITIYDVIGRKIRTLLNENKSAGSHTTIWNGLDNQGQSVTSGLYYYQLQAISSSGGLLFSQTRKMALVR